MNFKRNIPLLSIGNIILFLIVVGIVSAIILTLHHYSVFEIKSDVIAFIGLIVSFISFAMIIWIYADTNDRIKKEYEIQGKEKVLHAFVSRFLTHYQYDNPYSNGNTKIKYIKNHPNVPIVDANDLFHRLNTYKVNCDYLWAVLDFIREKENLNKEMIIIVKDWTDMSYGEFLKTEIEIRKHYKLPRAKHLVKGIINEAVIYNEIVGHHT